MALKPLLGRPQTATAIFWMATAANGGSDSNDGLTEGAPKLTLPAALALITAPGNELRIIGGPTNNTFLPSGSMSNAWGSLSDDGTSGQPIRIRGWYNGDRASYSERPVLDGRNVSSASVSAIRIFGDWIIFEDINVTRWCEAGGFQAGAIEPFGANITLRRCSAFANKCVGIGHQTNGSEFSNLLVENCDSFNNNDTQSAGENADGFQIGFGTSAAGTTTFRGCRSWGNSDDGFDNWQQNSPVIYENCWAFNNGGASGDGNGYKGQASDGSAESTGTRLYKNCLAWDNNGAGWINNTSEAVSMTHYNCTSYSNDVEGFDCQGTATLRNCIALSNSPNTDFGGSVDDTFNSWNGGVTATTGDFLSIDSTGADGARQSDGSLPELDFLRLAPGSDLIDAGTDVGLPFNGAAPDMGAYESD